MINIDSNGTFLFLIDAVSKEPFIFPLSNIDLITSGIDEDELIRETVDNENKEYIPPKYTIITTKGRAQYKLNESIEDVWSVVFKRTF